jgi:nitronate monooxygenase
MLTELLGVRYPLIQSPMAGVQGVDLALAVSGAGALGSLPCAMLGPQAVRESLERIQAHSARVNINFFCHQLPEPDPARDAAWRAALLPYYQEFGVDAALAAAPVPARAPFSSDMADLLAHFRPAVVSFHFGLPAPDLLARVRGWGARVLCSATTLQEAQWLQAQGVDAIIAQGLEAGGHRGMFLTQDPSTQIGTLALVRQIVRAVRVPVIAAGGIADAAGVAAAMALGAAGVQVGTAYLLCPEATTGERHRAALQSDAARHTALTRVFSGRHARSIVNRLMREIPDDGSVVPAFPLAGAALAPLRQAAEKAGCGDFTSLWSGQNATGCAAVPAAQLTQALVRGFDRPGA